MGLFLKLTRQDITHDFVFVLEGLILRTGRGGGGELLVCRHQVGLDLVEFLLQGVGRLLKRLIRGLGGVKLILEIFKLGLHQRKLRFRVGRFERIDLLLRGGQFVGQRLVFAQKPAHLVIHRLLVLQPGQLLIHHFELGPVGFDLILRIRQILFGGLQFHFHFAQPLFERRHIHQIAITGRHHRRLDRRNIRHGRGRGGGRLRIGLGLQIENLRLAILQAVTYERLFPIGILFVNPLQLGVAVLEIFQGTAVIALFFKVFSRVDLEVNIEIPLLKGPLRPGERERDCDNPRQDPNQINTPTHVARFNLFGDKKSIMS